MLHDLKIQIYNFEFNFDWARGRVAVHMDDIEKSVNGVSELPHI